MSEQSPGLEIASSPGLDAWVHEQDVPRALSTGDPAPGGAELAQIVGFVRQIGLAVRWERIDEPTVLPGITIDHGVLVVDQDKVLHPGDLLHEAGHLAVVPAADRARLVHDAGADGGHEMMAIAWSYAAVCHLRLHPAVVFHQSGYRGGADNLVENFTAGRYVAVPLLQWLGMTVDARRAAEVGIEPYPQMIRWVLD